MSIKINMIIVCQLVNIIDTLTEARACLIPAINKFEEKFQNDAFKNKRKIKKNIRELKSIIVTLDIAKFRVEDFQTATRRECQKMSKLKHNKFKIIKK